MQQERLNADIQKLLEENDFSKRHIGPGPQDIEAMLSDLGYDSVAAFIDAVVPVQIRSESPLPYVAAMSETKALARLKSIAGENKILRSFIGQGYYGTFTPHVILRNLLENPAWYTAYTPYQPEISQGRLEALINFQTMVTDLTGMDLANASMLDEGTAAAEAMALCQRLSKSKAKAFFVDAQCLPQTIDILKTRAEPVGVNLIIGHPKTDLDPEAVFGAIFQYPGVDGTVENYQAQVEALHAHKGMAVFAADLLALMLIQSPGSLGADVVIGNTQRFGVPMGAGGPHAAYMATKEAFKRSLPGRLVGASVDAQGNTAYRLALQTREQHIRREKATSNICTAQVLLAVIASMYAVYHGPKRLKQIASRVHQHANVLASRLQGAGWHLKNSSWFDTLTVQTKDKTQAIFESAQQAGMNLRWVDAEHLGISLDETCTDADLDTLAAVFSAKAGTTAVTGLADHLLRQDAVLTHPVFNRYHSETEMLRYLRNLADKDIALDRAMIPLGSCTMKLNATAEMIPVTWPEMGMIHPFAPADQTVGYQKMIDELEEMLCQVTGYDGISLQPNAGSQGEYAGLLAIASYHQARGEGHRNVCLIPSSAHGTNPASAQMCGLKVVVVKCDDQGNVDLEDLCAKAEKHQNDLAAIMITYPSTHGVFEEHVREVADVVHQYGGQVYIDGANLNAMVGLCLPGKFGGDVSHLNLHKTFCIPHGGGGPGVGPVAVGEHLKPFLPGHRYIENERGGAPVSAAPWGSASILPITWMYMVMMGSQGLTQATEIAMLNANYIAHRLKDHFPVLYTGKNGRVAHECIIDVRPLKALAGISVDDIAKRLIDYGFHAPTMSFPVAGTLMIEPTESESKVELDRFCDAMIAIREEVAKIESGHWPKENNPLVNAPHTAQALLDDQWDKPYSRNQAAYPNESLKQSKYWPPVGRVDGVYGDKNLMCSCPSISDYE